MSVATRSPRKRDGSPHSSVGGRGAVNPTASIQKPLGIGTNKSFNLESCSSRSSLSAKITTFYIPPPRFYPLLSLLVSFLLFSPISSAISPFSSPLLSSTVLSSISSLSPPLPSSPLCLSYLLASLLLQSSPLHSPPLVSPALLYLSPLPSSLPVSISLLCFIILLLSYCHS